MEALARGTVSGLIEAATEKLPLDNLLKIASSPVGKKAIWNILEQMGTEATEEAVSYVANYIADAAAKDPNAEFSLKDMMLSALGGRAIRRNHGCGRHCCRLCKERKRQRTGGTAHAEERIYPAGGNGCKCGAERGTGGFYWLSQKS